MLVNFLAKSVDGGDIMYKRLMLSLLTGILVVALLMSGADAETLKWSNPLPIGGNYSLYWPSVSSDGSAVVGLDVSICSIDGAQNLGIKVFELKNGKWQKPITLASNGVKQSMPIFETHPVISGDGRTIIYLGLDKTSNQYYMYQVLKTSNGKWSTPTIMNAIPTGWFGTLISINKTGSTLAYLCGSGGFFGGTSTLYVTEKIKGEWQKPTTLSAPGYMGAAFSPALNSDGTKMAWVQANAVSEVFFSEKINGVWSEAVKLTNSPENEEFASISGDGNTVFFWRQYVKGTTIDGHDLFAVKKLGGKWSKEVKINSSKEASTLVYDSAAATDMKGDSVAFTHFNQVKDTISTSVLMFSEYIKGSWTKAKAITNSKYGFNLFPEMISDGKKIFYIDNTLQYINGTVAAPAKKT
jgi:hypothetical protein